MQINWLSDPMVKNPDNSDQNGSFDKNSNSLQQMVWQQDGYQPLIFSHDWQVAILNWEPAANANMISEVERHVQTDEVFILWRGAAALVTVDMDGLKITEAVPGVVYNVIMGSWHTVIGTRESSWIIVENRDTHLSDTEMRLLTKTELQEFNRQLPTWTLST